MVANKHVLQGQDSKICLFVCRTYHPLRRHLFTGQSPSLLRFVPNHLLLGKILVITTFRLFYNNFLSSFHPQPCLQPDFDAPRPQFPDLSLPSSLESPVAVNLDDFSLPGGPPGHDSQGLASVGTSSLNPASCPSSDLNPPNREQAFRTEFNLIYTCSPLNANLGNPVATDHRLSQSEGSFSPAESFHSSISGQGLLGDVGPGSMSPFGEPHYGGGYPDSGTPPHTSNPPQKKKASSPHPHAQNLEVFCSLIALQVNPCRTFTFSSSVQMT